MHSEDALRKIKKCLAIARDKRADPNVAASAMRQAQALMAAHNLSESDVSLSDVTQHCCATKSPKHSRWMTALASTIASAFGCDLIWTRGVHLIGRSFVRRHEVIFVGVGSASTIAGYAWDVLARQCSKARLAHIRSQPGRCKPITLTARGDVFAEGWVVAVRDKIEHFAGNVRDQRLIEKYMELTWPDSDSFRPKSRAKGRNVSHNDFHQGHRAGEAAQLNHGVAGRAQELLA